MSHIDIGKSHGFCLIGRRFSSIRPSEAPACWVRVNSGTATLVTTFSSPGSHQVTATYLGDANNADSDDAKSLAVTGSASSTTSVTASPSPVSLGQEVGLTATVIGSSPTGSVTFTLDGATLGSAQIAGGTASISVAFQELGSHTIVASYVGDANNAGSTGSTALNVTLGSPDAAPGPMTWQYRYDAQGNRSTTRSNGSTTTLCSTRSRTSRRSVSRPSTSWRWICDPSPPRRPSG